MMIIVCCAFFHSTGLNAGTPLATASVPVMAEQPSAKALQSRNRPMVSVATPVSGCDVLDLWKLAGQRAEHADGDEQQHRADEDVGGAGEQRAALPQSAQVHDHDQQDRERDQRNRHGLKHRKGRIESLDAGRHAHGHGQHVVGEERSGGDEAGQHAQVGVGHDVAAAAVGIGPDRLAIAEGDDDQQGDDDDGQPEDVLEAVLAGADQDEHHGAGRVGDGGHHVRREDRQGLPLGQALGQLRGG